jgi:hypothetical protein
MSKIFFKSKAFELVNVFLDIILSKLGKIFYEVLILFGVLEKQCCCLKEFICYF